MLGIVVDNSRSIDCLNCISRKLYSLMLAGAALPSAIRLDPGGGGAVGARVLGRPRHMLDVPQTARSSFGSGPLAPCAPLLAVRQFLYPPTVSHEFIANQCGVEVAARRVLFCQQAKCPCEFRNGLSNGDYWLSNTYFYRPPRD